MRTIEVKEAGTLHSHSRGTQESSGTPAGVGDALLAAVVSERDGLFFVLDRDLRYLVFSEGHAQAFRDLYGTEVAVGRPIADCITVESDREEVLPDARRALAGETFTTSSTLGAAGRERSYGLTWSPLRLADGSIGGAVLFGRDVTSLAASRDAQRLAEDRLRVLIDSLPDAAWLVDRDRRILLANEAYRLTELRAGGRPTAEGDVIAREGYAQDVLDAWEACYMRAFGGEAFTAELSYDGADGRHTSEVTFTPLREGEPVERLVVTARDITARRRAEEALEAAEEQYRLLAENAADVVFRQVDGVLEWIAPSVRDLLGWDPSDLIGRTTIDLLHPDDRESAARARAAAHAGETIRAEGRLRTRDGSYVWVETVARPFTAAGGRPGQIGALRDVTARRAALDELAASERRLRATLDSMLDPHVLLEAVRDGDGRIVDFTYADANRAACFYMDMAPEELVGATVLELLPGQASSGMLALYAEALESGEPLVLDDYAYPHEIVGSERRYDIRGVRVGDALSFTWRDVTERHEDERRLAASEELYRSVVSTSHEAIFVQQPGGRIVAWNDAATRVYGIAEAAALSSPDGLTHLLPDVVREDGSPVPVDELPSRRTLATGEPFCDVVLGFRRGDEQRWISVSTSPLFEDGDDAPRAVVVSAGDITDAREAERALRRIEAARDAAERAGLTGVMQVDFENDTILWSLGMYALYDIPVDGSVGLAVDRQLRLGAVASRLAPDDVERFQEAIRTARAGTPSWATDLRVLHRDGGEHVLRHTVSPARGPDGRIVRLDVLCQDVTAALAAGEEIARLSAMRDVAEQVARQGSWRWDLDTNEVEWSAEMYRLHDLDPAELHGEFAVVIETRLHADDRPAATAAVARYLAEGGPLEYRYRAVHRDGSVRVIETIGTQVEGEADGARILSGYSRDVTAEVAAAAEVARLQQMRDRAEEIARVGSVGVDLETGASTWSPEVYRLLDVDPEAGPRGFLALLETRVHPDDRDGLRDSFALPAAGDASLASDFRVVWRDGSEHVLHREATVERDGDGRPLRVTGYLQDVTAQRALEERLRHFNEELADRVFERTAQLEAANRELEAFVYSAAHDLRAPLRAIDGFSELVAEGAADRLNEAERADLQRVRGAAQRMALLIDHLMTLARASRQEPSLEPVDVTRLVCNVAAEVCGPEPQRPLELVVAPGLTAVTDAGILRQVLTDLFENAWKFTARHETARIEVGSCEVDGESAFFVRDDGAGFDPAAATHLFGPFQRYHAAADFPGDGIGLATVQRLLARLGGRVWAEAEVEKGATFYFTVGSRGSRARS